MDLKIGIGYDVHKLVEGRKLILGGVEVPYEKGLAGHSDADVLLHAICDAILGALAKGDIGEHFPDNDPEYKDISSLLLLDHVVNIMKKCGFVINNIDAIVQAEEPNLKEFKRSICASIAGRIGISKSVVNLKATTMEELGPIGRKEGIAAMATVLLIKS